MLNFPFFFLFLCLVTHPRAHIRRVYMTITKHPEIASPILSSFFYIYISFGEIMGFPSWSGFPSGQLDIDARASSDPTFSVSPAYIPRIHLCIYICINKNVYVCLSPLLVQSKPEVFFFFLFISLRLFSCLTEKPSHFLDCM